MKILNVAIIAHVDHGKTTLVDGLLKQSNTFRENEAYMSQMLILDSNDQERERGITILAKNTSVFYKNTKINIIDTPGHSDFSGEVERTLSMADGAILLVDAQEGTMPQTKFVLRKALELGLKVIVLVNKIDKKDADVKKTINKIYDLFLELASNDKQLDFPVLYAIGRDGKAWNEYPEDLNAEADLEPIFESILKNIPEHDSGSNSHFQMLVTSLDWDSYKGQYALGKVDSGKISKGQKVFLVKQDGTVNNETVDRIYITEGLKKVEVEEASAGEIVSITGMKEVTIGDTISEIQNPNIVTTIKISEPTINIYIGANTSPFVGKEGSILTSRQLLKRIQEELKTNVAMRFAVNDSNQFILSGRGELHLCIFLETLRREGFEIEIGKPQVITKVVDEKVLEPVEEYTVDISPEYVDGIIAEFTRRSGILVSQENNVYTRLVFEIPTKYAFGLSSTLMTLSKGTAIVGSIFLRYQEVASKIRKIRKGVLIAMDTGKVTAYAMDSAQERGTLFVVPGTQVYAGMIVGVNSRDEDIELNICKEKHLTNMRSKGEVGISLNASREMSLEKCFGFIEEDELLEITPQNLRMRKKVLDPILRKRMHSKSK